MSSSCSTSIDYIFDFLYLLIFFWILNLIKKSNNFEGPLKIKLNQMKIKIVSWDGVATWLWDIEEVKCIICQNDFETPCPKCKIPGDDCVPVQGKCTHNFHLHCIERWLSEGKEKCPLCRNKWDPKNWFHCMTQTVYVDKNFNI